MIAWSPTALSHLEDILDFIALDKPKAAEEVSVQVYESVSLLEANPMLGRAGRVEGTRELVISTYPSYVVVYEVSGADTHILAVMHGRQRWPETF